ncbi:FAD-binding and (Fe-S)-binding domain-containing protein [uncultured Tateyamaria sp.]|uniref:FAD-binding and (Fe-S)-binding domain-containing protein n=1 Tax=uncultured Tateyamaria sp. TaxID=455651 RepID=UPI00261D5872|nr:FAD-binding and (Fe-S)-binding domain-containing protein [uncultured Tateyamaria sp.]
MLNYKSLAQRIEGDVLTGDYDRGRYATDASIYQIVPKAVVVPKRWDDVEAALSFAREAGIPVLARGGGTSQSGQTVGDALVVDFSKHLNRIREYDPESGTVRVEPGLVLDDLNRRLKVDGWWYPVDVSTASRATLGGMAANNSCGSRSIRYGKMQDNLVALEAMLADGSVRSFGREPAGSALDSDLIALANRDADEIAARFPNVSRRVGGYNVDALVGASPNMAHLMVGSEGTLGLTKTLDLALSPVLTHKTLGVCHFPTFRAAMDAAQHIVKLDPVAVELVDHTMIRLGREIPQFRPIVDAFVRGAPQALLLVEFAETPAENRRRLTALGDLMADLGFLWGDPGKAEGGVVEAEDPAFQAQIWGVRTQGLNIMMSMRAEGKPVSFVEDCAVPLQHLADFTDQLTEVFRKHGTDGTWYAHASVGLLHVRPVLNLRQEMDVRSMRAIAEEAFDLVARFKGSHSGEHGDGIVRSEFHERMFGTRMVRLFEEVKDRFDPDGVLNPGKIVRAPKMDDRSLMRWPEGYAQRSIDTVFDWEAWPGGLAGAAEMCNNNGACRKSTGGVMCPSFRVTGNERDLTRGRANTVRLALTGQLGDDPFASDDMAETMALCVGCKACKSECPMSVDMARMKTEAQAARCKAHGLPLRDQVIANLPRLAPFAAKARSVVNAAGAFPSVLERTMGISRTRRLPRFQAPIPMSGDGDVLLFADTFNRYFDPANLAAAQRVIRHTGLTVGFVDAPGRPLCCGRTYLSSGMVERARSELTRTVEAFRSALDQGKTIVGLEPSCTLMFRDEAPDLVPGWTAEMGAQVLTFAEYMAQHPLEGVHMADTTVLVHGHCHQKAQGVASATVAALSQIGGVTAQMIDSSCCGMAGQFGYQAETDGVSRQMAELSLAPAIRAAAPDTQVVADGFSCRCQIKDVTDRKADNLAVFLDRAISG